MPLDFMPYNGNMMDIVYCSISLRKSYVTSREKSAIISLTWHWWGTIHHLKSFILFYFIFFSKNKRQWMNVFYFWSLNRNGEVYSFLKKYHLTNNISANESFKSVKKKWIIYIELHIEKFIAYVIQLVIFNHWLLHINVQVW